MSVTARFDPQCAPLGKPKRKRVEERPIEIPREMPAAPRAPGQPVPRKVPVPA